MHRLILLIALGFPLSASAEVADKIASYPTMWGISIVTSLILGGLSYWKPAFLALALVASGVLAASYFDMTTDDYFRQRVVEEMGAAYLISGFLSTGLVIAVSIAAALVRRKTKDSLRR